MLEFLFEVLAGPNLVLRIDHRARGLLFDAARVPVPCAWADRATP